MFGGMDLSGSTQGAGRVGGHLASSEHSGTNRTPYYPTCDNNGNVSEYPGGDGSVAARYEYDAFGNTAYSSEASPQTPETRNQRPDRKLHLTTTDSLSQDSRGQAATLAII
jgi:uncharacterized protein RhaS with RHS repeats